MISGDLNAAPPQCQECWGEFTQLRTCHQQWFELWVVCWQTLNEPACVVGGCFPPAQCMQQMFAHVCVSYMYEQINMETFSLLPVHELHSMTRRCRQISFLWLMSLFSRWYRFIRLRAIPLSGRGVDSRLKKKQVVSHLSLPLYYSLFRTGSGDCCLFLCGCCTCHLWFLLLLL